MKEFKGHSNGVQHLCYRLMMSKCEVCGFSSLIHYVKESKFITFSFIWINSSEKSLFVKYDSINILLYPANLASLFLYKHIYLSLSLSLSLSLCVCVCVFCSSGLDRFCRFNQSDPCYAALGHKLNLLNLSKNDTKIRNRINNNSTTDPACRVKDGKMRECDLYSNRPEVTVINETLIINRVIRADSGNYTVSLSLSDGSVTSTVLQVNVEGTETLSSDSLQSHVLQRSHSLKWISWTSVKVFIPAAHYWISKSI